MEKAKKHGKGRSGKVRLGGLVSLRYRGSVLGGMAMLDRLFLRIVLCLGDTTLTALLLARWD